MKHKNKITLCLGLLSTSVAFSQTYTGEVGLLVSDNFKQKSSETIYQLNEGGETYTLHFKNAEEANNLKTGDLVTLEGEEIQGVHDKIIIVKSIAYKKKIAQPLSFMAPETHTILAMIVDFPNMKATSKVKVPDVEKILYDNQTALQHAYQRSSFGQVLFNRDGNGDGTPDVKVVSLNYNATTCDYNKWAEDALTYVKARGVNVSMFKHHMLIVPENIPCSWAGLGYVGCGTNCRTWIRAYDPTKLHSQQVYAHEIGHNLGMHHSATDLNNDGTIDNEYGDDACVMGVAGFNSFKEVNAPHRDQLNWFSAVPNKLKTITPDSNLYTIYPLEQGVSSPGLLALKLTKNSTQNYYISYRKNIGPFGPGASNWLDKVSIHYTKTGDSKTYFVKALATGETFTDAVNKIKITAVTAGGSNAQVKVARTS